MPELLLSLVTFAVIATASPGGATTLATASGMRFGLTRSLPLLFGIAIGLSSLVGVVAGGLGSLVMSWPVLQFWLKLVGSAYLLWLAWTIGRRGAPTRISRCHLRWPNGSSAAGMCRPPSSTTSRRRSGTGNA